MSNEATRATKLTGFVWADGVAQAARELSRGYSYESVERAVEDNLELRTETDDLYYVSAEIVDTETRP